MFYRVEVRTLCRPVRFLHICSWANLKAAWRLEVCSHWLCRKLATTVRLSIRWPCSVILHGRPLRGWVAVVPNHFHFVIKPLTADCGIISSEEISRLDLLHRCHPWIHWANGSDPFLHMFVGAWIHTPVAMEVIGTPEFNYMDGWVNTFGSIAYLHIRWQKAKWPARLWMVVCCYSNTRSSVVHITKSWWFPPCSTADITAISLWFQIKVISQ